MQIFRLPRLPGISTLSGVMTETPTQAVQGPNVALLLSLTARHARFQKYLAIVKDQEMKMRKKIVELAFANPKVGTNRLELPQHAFNIKALVKEGIKADEAGLQDILDCIPKDNKEGLCKWKPEMSLSKFNALPQEYKDMLAGNVTIKPESPTVEYDGELPTFSVIDQMKLEGGLIYINNAPLDQATADNYAYELGLNGALELVKLLEEIS